MGATGGALAYRFFLGVGMGVRIVRVANYVTATSGGLRTALRELGAGYERAGHESVLIVPGERDGDDETEQGRVITLAGPRVPGLGGYRALIDRRRVGKVLSQARFEVRKARPQVPLRLRKGE